MVTSFGERIERQLENRLRNLAVVELMNTKQNEVLADVDLLKGAIAELMVSNESLRSEMKILMKETSQRNNSNIEKIAEIFSDANQLKRDAYQEAQMSELFLKEQLDATQAKHNELNASNAGISNEIDTSSSADAPTSGKSSNRISLDYL